jgi:DNA-binding transcriptional LysR family regulator
VHLPLPTNNVVVDKLDPEPLYLIAPETHRLGQCSEADFRELKGEAFILLGRQYAPVFHDRVLLLAHESGVVLNVKMEARHFTETLSLVAGGLGISIIPGGCRDHPWKGVRYCRLKTTISDLELGIITRKDEHSELVGNFVQLARSSTG